MYPTTGSDKKREIANLLRFFSQKWGQHKGSTAMGPKRRTKGMADRRGSSDPKDSAAVFVIDLMNPLKNGSFYTNAMSIRITPIHTKVASCCFNMWTPSLNPLNFEIAPSPFLPFFQFLLKREWRQFADILKIANFENCYAF